MPYSVPPHHSLRSGAPHRSTSRLSRSAAASKVTIKVPPMSNQPVLRRSSRHSAGTESMPSGSEYHESEKSMVHDADADADADGEPEEEQAQIVYTQTSRGRKLPKKSYKESETEEEKGQPEGLFDEGQEVVADDDEYGDEDMDRHPPRRRNTRS